jgi:ribosomal protein S18 acetylase RimI-like enzyme
VVEIEIKDLTMAQLKDVLELQENVYHQLQEKEVLETLSREEFTEIIKQGFIIGVYDGDNLVATRSMYIPDVSEDEHLANDTGIKDKNSVIYSEISFINPQYRGQNLQTTMGAHLIDKVRQDGRFKHCLTTVMPTNVPSLKDKFKLGFKIMATKLKYNGKRRHILRLDLEQPIQCSGDALKVAYDDIGWMMQNGDQYVGDHFDGNVIYYYKKQEDLI